MGVLTGLALVAAMGGTGVQAKPGRKRTTTTTTTPVPATTSTSTPVSTSTTTSTTSTVVPVTTTTTTVTPGPTRQAWQWPFDASSPWNRGVGSGAVYEAATGPLTSGLRAASATPWLNAGSYSQPIVTAGDSDPMATVTRAGHPNVYYRIPDGVRPAQGTDMNLNVVQPNRRWLDESWLMQGANPLWSTGYHTVTDLWGSGMGTGTRAAGASAAAGLIRASDLSAGSIRHALALAITNAQLRSGWVWPATSQDGDAQWSYTGQVPMGTYVAIPTGVDVRALGLTAEGIMLARALQDYGAYVVDRAGAFVFYAEPSLESSSAVANMRRDVAAIRTQLRVVVNNSSSSVNGGGTPRVAPAPAFG